MKLCSRCKKNPAVIFISKIEGDKTTQEGLCMKCAIEMNIGPIKDMLNKMGNAGYIVPFQGLSGPHPNADCGRANIIRRLHDEACAAVQSSDVNHISVILFLSDIFLFLLQMRFLSRHRISALY